MEPVSAAVRRAASTPSLPYHFRRKKERCLSWTHIKEIGKEKRKSFDGSQPTRGESLQRETCKDSCKRKPLWSSRCNSVPLSISKTKDLSKHLKLFYISCFRPTHCIVFLHKYEQTLLDLVLAFGIESLPTVETKYDCLFSLRCPALGSCITKCSRAMKNSITSIAVFSLVLCCQTGPENTQSDNESKHFSLL